MIREIICNVCQLLLREDELLEHLVSKHQWQQMPLPLPPVTIDESNPMVACPKCGVQVSQKKLAKHIRRKHPSANSVVAAPKLTKPKVDKPKVELVSLRGTRVTGLRRCEQCKVNHMEHWVYRYSDGSSKTLCLYCKQKLLDKVKHRKTDVLDHCLPGCAMSGKRR